MDTTDLMRRIHRLRHRLIALRSVSVTLCVVAVCVVCYPLAMQLRSDIALAALSQQVSENVAGWPYPQAEEALAAARAYNERLAQSGQPVLGEVADPFSTTSGASGASGADDTISSRDEEYQSLLDAGDGVMGTVRVPSVSIELPIYHGTSEAVLAQGAGHLYGTSLPVGGESSHSVITGHRGLVSALMFTRLDEVHEGDFFYVEVMGETLGYRVDRISVILPDDVSQLKVEQGIDRMTLMTCTPYGVNTHRLLISGTRVTIPDPAPEPSNVPDARETILRVALGVLGVGWLLVWTGQMVFSRGSSYSGLTGAARHRA
ncbi:class C sortase [Bifidobacterium avesanii]|uniref:class C sortase n=1 Tax=Bifidobacterium avesanii TaxID=1798157 RepID=UPI003B846193